MPYNITLTNGTELVTGGLLDNTLDTTNSSLSLVGKNYKSYGLFVNQNFVRLLENFANTSAPTAPLPGQLWFNSTTKLLNVNVASTKGTANAIWKTVAGMTISATTPTNAYTGEQWYNTSDGQLNIYTGTGWRLIGPLSKLSTGNTGAIPDTVENSPGTATYVVIKFFIDNVLVGVWSKEDTFISNLSGFSTIKKGLNLHSSLQHTFWGNSEVANSLYYNGVALSGNAYLRSDTSGVVNGSLALTNDGGLTFGAANDFVGNVFGGTVILKNQTNNKDFILSLKSSNNQTPFLRGNYITGLAEAFNNPTASSPGLSYVTKSYLDIVTGVSTGLFSLQADFVPESNNLYTLGNTSNYFSNIFSTNATLTNLYGSNLFVTQSNIAQIFVSADITPSASNLSNIGSSGRNFNFVHAQSGIFNNLLNVAGNLNVSGNTSVTQNSTIGANLSVVGNLVLASTINSSSVSTVSFFTAGGVGIGGNINIGGSLSTPFLTTPITGNAIIAGGLIPSANISYNLGNTSSRWSNIFSENLTVANVFAANVFALRSNTSIIYLGSDIIPTDNFISNLGQPSKSFLNFYSRDISVSSNATIGNVTTNLITSTTGNLIGVLSVNGNLVAAATTASTSTTTGALVVRGGAGIAGATNIGGVLGVTGNIVADSGITSISTSTGAIVVNGGIGVSGNINVGGAIYSPTMPSGTSNTAVATTAFVQTITAPTGSLIMWPTGNPPSGYLLCNGAAISRTTFSSLFSVIGITFGSGNGSTTFNLPNYTNRLPVGAGGLYSAGDTGGSKDANVVSHTHTLSGGSVSGTFVTAVTPSFINVDGVGAPTSVVENISSSTGSATLSNPTVQSSGSSGTNQNMPPYLAINFIIKT